MTATEVGQANGVCAHVSRFAGVAILFGSRALATIYHTVNVRPKYNRMAAAASSTQNLISRYSYQGPSVKGMEIIMDPKHLQVGKIYIIVYKVFSGHEVESGIEDSIENSLYRGITVKYNKRVGNEGDEHYRYEFEVLERSTDYSPGSKFTAYIPDPTVMVFDNTSPNSFESNGGYRRRGRYRRHGRKSTRRHHRGRKSTRRHHRRQ